MPVSYISVNEAQVAKSMGPAPKIGSYASATTAMASASLSNTNTPLFKAATASSTNANASQPTKPSKTSSLVPTPKLPRVRAVYDYDAANDQELTIREGDEIEVMRDMDDGWSEGRLLSTGKVGQYPSK